jgi:hypothetical protein
MLKNDPPSGTVVTFVRQVRKAKAQDAASLIRALGRYTVERPGDEFEVLYNGEIMTVERQDIEEARTGKR